MDEQDEIEKLIAQENNPQLRLQLMIMNRINLSLIANTRTTDEIAEKLEQHLEQYQLHASKEEALLNKGRGAWKVVAIVIGAVQVIGLGIWNEARSDIASIHTALQAESLLSEKTNFRLDALERLLK